METSLEKSANTSEDDERFRSALLELEKIQKEVVATKDWYERHSTRPRIFFQIVGSATIILSVLVPFVGTLDGVWKTLVLPAVTIAIAGLTSLNAFFQWQSQWQGHRQTQFALEHLLSRWDIEIVKARLETDRERAVEIAIEGTIRLLDQAREVTSAQTEDYFKSVQLPAAK